MHICIISKNNKGKCLELMNMLDESKEQAKEQLKLIRANYGEKTVRPTNRLEARVSYVCSLQK